MSRAPALQILKSQDCIGLDHFLIDDWKEAHVRLIVVNGEGSHVSLACAHGVCAKDCSGNGRSTHVNPRTRRITDMEFARGLLKNIPRPLRAMPALSTRTSSADGAAGCA
jgi:hypothetical protein